MALGDTMSSRLSQTSGSVSVSNHLDEFSGRDDGDAISRRRESEASSSEAGNAMVTTSMAYLPHNVMLCEMRHENFEDCVPSGPPDCGVVSKWRPKDRMKTGCVALVLCLNISVDPPDVIKISPCARMECWIDPFSMAAPKALETIGKTLHVQYERWQPRARYKLQLDPTVDELKKLCTMCRKNAKSERVLFHYNGHGVPKPTPNGEIWLFNKSYTQYIPLPISDLNTWLKTPSIYVLDCSAAGQIVKAFKGLLEDPSTSNKDCILLAACEAHETLPQSADFPADVFTSCLTTPIKMALRWFCNRSLLRDNLDHAFIDQIPGRQNDRKTLLGELNWIFTAVTDTIAWNVLPREQFQQLFRQDLLVASLFRNFLLAERVMRSANCSPVSFPKLPSTHQHHMWDAWDMAAEICLSQLSALLEEPNVEFQSTPFFTEHLTAFEVWLDHGFEHKKRPEQLPIVLQVLLSQSHRFRALVLLGRFLDMGPWAVDQALSVGIFPFVLKLLQTNASELRHILVFIWAKILALDKSCQVDLVKDKGHEYFINLLDSEDAYPEQRAMAAFVLAVTVDGHRQGQEACIDFKLVAICLKHLELANPLDVQTEPLFLQWLCLCLGKCWEDYPEAQLIGIQSDALSVCAPYLSEPQPEVRASATFALGSLLDVTSNSSSDGHGGEEDSDDYERMKTEIDIVKYLLKVSSDGSPLVRAEVAVALARFTFRHNRHLKSFAAAYMKQQPNYLANTQSSLSNNDPNSSHMYACHCVQSSNGICSTSGTLPGTSSDGTGIGHEGRISTGISLSSSNKQDSSFPDISPQPSNSSVLLKDSITNGVSNFSRSHPQDNGIYSQCVLTIYALAKDPSPRVASIGRKILSIIGIEQMVAKSLWFGGAVRMSESTQSSPIPNLAGLTRSSSLLDLNPGNLTLTFRTPPVSPPRPNYLQGIRRVSSFNLNLRPMNSPESGLADSLLGSSGSAGNSERSLLPQSSIYNWSCGHFARPLLTASDDNEKILNKREDRERFALDRIAKCQHSSTIKLNNEFAIWDTKFETGMKISTLLQPFSPIVIAADENERIRVWNYEESTLLNSFDNHNFPDKGISKLCLVNELDDSLLLVASYDGSVRLWKNYTMKDKQKLVTAFPTLSVAQTYKSRAHNVNVAVDWQQQSGYLYCSGDVPSVAIWDLDKEMVLSSVPSSSESNISVLSASQVHGGQFAAGFIDGSIRLFDIRTSGMPICSTRPHIQRVERVVGLGFQPGLDPLKIVSASQAGDIQFLDIRKQTNAYLTIDAHRGSLTALAIHRHAPVIASGSAKQLIKVFSLEGEQVSLIRFHPSFMAQKIGPVSFLTFHPYKVMLSAASTDSCVTIYADENPQNK